MSSWVDEFIGLLQDALSKNGGSIKFNAPDGQEILVNIEQKLVDLIIKSRPQLEKISEQAFKDFLLRMSRHEDFDALVAIYTELDCQALIDKYQYDSIRLAQLAEEMQKSRDFWIWFGKQLGQRIVFGALGALF